MVEYVSVLIKQLYRGVCCCLTCRPMAGIMVSPCQYLHSPLPLLEVGGGGWGGGGVGRMYAVGYTGDGCTYAQLNSSTFIKYYIDLCGHNPNFYSDKLLSNCLQLFQRILNHHRLSSFWYPYKIFVPKIFSRSYYHFLQTLMPNANEMALLNAILLEHELKENYVLYFWVRTFKLQKLFHSEYASI